MKTIDELQALLMRNHAPERYDRVQKYRELIESATSLTELVNINRSMYQDYGRTGSLDLFLKPWMEDISDVKVNGVPVDVLENMKESHKGLYGDAFDSYRSYLSRGTLAEESSIYFDAVSSLVEKEQARLGMSVDLRSVAGMLNDGPGPYPIKCSAGGRVVQSSYMLSRSGEGVSLLLPDGWHRQNLDIGKNSVDKVRWRDVSDGGLYSITRGARLGIPEPKQAEQKIKGIKF